MIRNNSSALRKRKGVVIFDDDGKRKLISINKIKVTSFTFIDNVLLVDSSKHNLFSISQLYNKYFKQ